MDKAAVAHARGTLTWLQAGRGVAACLVVMQHTAEVFSFPKYWATTAFHPLGIGERGVEFFFVLSGFIMLHVHWRDLDNPRRLASFAWKRFARIYPVWWILLAAVVPIFLLDPAGGLGYEREPREILSSFLLIPFDSHDPVLNVGWTLCREVLFYALFGLAIVNLRVGAVAFALWAALCVLEFNRVPGFPWDFLGSTRNLQFLMGLSAAVLVRRVVVPAPRLVVAAGAVLLAACAGTELFHDVLTPSEWTTAYGLAWTVLIVGAVGIEDRHGIIAPASALAVGDASYSIYLVHALALTALAKLFAAAGWIGTVPPALAFALIVLASIGAGVIFHRAIERPVLRWLRRRPAAVTPS